MTKGKFIVLEGIEGVGKTTQIPLLKEYLESNDIPVITTLEPGGTKIGQKIREILLNFNLSKMDHITELLLFNAARTQHINEIIMPALKKGTWVISDRYSDSTLAYQGYGRGFSNSIINDIDQISTKCFKADLTIILDLPVEIGLNRNSKIGKKDRLELESIKFHERVRKGFHKIVKTKENVEIINTEDKSIELVQKLIQNVIQEFLLEEK